MQVPGHLGAERQVPGVEALDLLHRGPGVLARLKMFTLPSDRMIRMQIAVCRSEYSECGMPVNGSVFSPALSRAALNCLWTILEAVARFG